MTFNWLTNMSDVATVLSGIGLVGGVAWRVLRKMRINDLAHLDVKADRNYDALTRIEATVTKTADRLDDHLEAHAEGRFDK